eukprot:COSAG02_NODE_9098_length_2332_cov_1.397223_2_plen_283_part_00
MESEEVLLRAEARRLAERVLQQHGRRPTMALEHSRRHAAASDSATRWRLRSWVDATVSPVRPRARSPAGPQSGEVGRKALPSRGDIEDEPVVLELEPHHWRVLQLLHPRLRKLCRESLCDQSGEQRVIDFLAQHELLPPVSAAAAADAGRHHRRAATDVRRIAAKWLAQRGGINWQGNLMMRRNKTDCSTAAGWMSSSGGCKRCRLRCATRAVMTRSCCSARLQVSRGDAKAPSCGGHAGQPRGALPRRSIGGSQQIPVCAMQCLGLCQRKDCELCSSSSSL